MQENDKMISDKNVWKRRQDYSKQFMLSGHFYGFWGIDLEKFYPGLCDEKVFPIFIKDEYVDINYSTDLFLAKKLLGAKND